MVTLVNYKGEVKYEGLTASEAKRISTMTGFVVKAEKKATKAKTVKKVAKTTKKTAKKAK